MGAAIAQIGSTSPTVDGASDESAWSAVSALPPTRFSRPLAEPAVRVSTQRALHGYCRQAFSAAGQGLGIAVPRQR